MTHQVAKRGTKNGNQSQRQRVVQRVTKSGTTGDNEWQRMTTNDKEWQRLVTLANFSYSRIKEEPATMRTKENSLNIQEDLEKRLLN